MASVTAAIRTEVIASGFQTPYGIAVLGDEELLVTEREGGLFYYRQGEFSRIAGFPRLIVEASGSLAVGRLMDVSLHPRFSRNRFVYVSYSTAAALHIARFRFQSGRAEGFEVIYAANAPAEGSKTAWEDGNHFFVSAGIGGFPRPL